MIKVYLVGRLTKAPEHKQTPNGISVCTFSVATNRRMNREITDFFNVVAWRGLADTCSKFLVKGQQVAVIGELQNRSYEDQTGTKRYITEIVADEVEFLAKPGAQPNGQATPTTPGAELFAELGEELPEEDLPF